ncbi:hypothetical protein ACTZWW_21190 [Salinarimonas sp. NSM]|uniref:hypothetical protein n=1 Tax=Salinarimonas sp. NSM TaxID=3458003 RepID=UPI004035D1AB
MPTVLSLLPFACGAAPLVIGALQGNGPVAIAGAAGLALWAGASMPRGVATTAASFVASALAAATGAPVAAVVASIWITMWALVAGSLGAAGLVGVYAATTTGHADLAVGTLERTEHIRRCVQERQADIGGDGAIPDMTACMRFLVP